MPFFPRVLEVAEVQAVEGPEGRAAVGVLEGGEDDPGDRQQRDQLEHAEHHVGDRLLRARCHTDRSEKRLIPSEIKKMIAVSVMPTAAAEPTWPDSNAREKTWNAGTVVASPGPPWVVL